MAPVSIRIDTSQLKKLTRALDDFARKQVPFATAQAINAVAKKVQQAEQENMRKVLDRPTPFTVNAVGVKLASKSSLTALVYVKPVAAAYLAPYEEGGLNKLNSKALLKPVGQKVNQYGNLPTKALARLKAKPNVFVGKVKTKAGVVDGFWQRTKKTRGKAAGLKLLVKFEDAHAVRQHLDYRGVAKRVVSREFKVEFSKAMAKALATAKK